VGQLLTVMHEPDEAEIDDLGEDEAAMLDVTSPALDVTSIAGEVTSSIAASSSPRSSISASSGSCMTVSLEGSNIQLSFQKDDQSTAVIMDASAARALVRAAGIHDDRGRLVVLLERELDVRAFEGNRDTRH
jgi:inosine-uridine nucleoside N-ribohydrolase